MSEFTKKPLGSLIPSDPSLLHERLKQEERELLAEIRKFEKLLRQFEDQDQPAYQSWLRREFGQTLSFIEETVAKIRMKQLLLMRVQHFMDTRSHHPREALHEAMHGATPQEEAEHQARKRAKLETKRELRREAKKNKRKAERRELPSQQPERDSPRKRIVSLYRELARRLHPDATRAEGATAAHHQRIWLEVQAAYESSDLSRLLSLASWLDSGDQEDTEPASAAHVRSFSERFENLRALRKSLTQTERRVLDLRDQPAWNFVGNTDPSARKQLRRELKAELEDELTQALASLEACEEAIRSIGPARPPRKSEEPRKGRR